MPRPGEDRSDVGGAAQFNNIGPVPLSAVSRFLPNASPASQLAASLNRSTVARSFRAWSGSGRSWIWRVKFIPQLQAVSFTSQEEGAASSHP